MIKKLVLALFICAMLLTLCACGNTDTPVDNEPETTSEPKTTAEESSESYALDDGLTDETEAEEPESETQAVPETFSYEELAHDFRTMSIRKEDGRFLPISRVKDSTNTNVADLASEGVLRRSITWEDYYVRDMYGSFILLSDYKFPVVEKTDKITLISSMSMKKYGLFLAKAEQVCYTVPLEAFTSHCSNVYNILNPRRGIKDKNVIGDTVSYPDSLTLNGIPFDECEKTEGWYSFEKGDEVLLEWYDGTVYHTETMYADYPVYTFASGDDIIKVEGTLTKNGYVEFDVTGIPSGLYYAYAGNWSLEDPLYRDKSAETRTDDAIYISND